MFKNMRIGVRLGMGFGLVVVLMVAIAVIGITRMATLNESLENINNDKWPKVLLLQDGLAGVNAIGLGARDILMARTSRAFRARRSAFSRAQQHRQGLGEA